MGAVPEHDPAQIAGLFGGVNAALEAVFVQQRQKAGVVNVGVGQQHEIDLSGGDGEVLILKNVSSLFHAAVHKAVLTAAGEQGAAAGYFMSCA